MSRNVRFVNKIELDNIEQEPSYAPMLAIHGMTIACNYCGSENSAVFDPNDICQKCSAPLSTGDVLMGLLGSEEIWLRYGDDT